MINPHSVKEPFAFWLIREFLAADEDGSEELQPIDDKEFYSVLGLLVAGIAILALTIGPLAVL